MKVINGWVDSAVEIDYGNKSMGRNGWKPLIIVLHGTAGGSSAQDIAYYFRDGAEQASAHFVIGQDGTVVQGISCDVAAWGNGLTTAGHDAFLPDSNVVNGNWYTISIEHCKPHDDNSDQLTDAQKASSFALVDALCSAYGIPRKVATSMDGGILGHHDFDPVNRSRCPGPYPTDELIAYLNPVTTSGVPHTTGGHPRMTPNENMLKAAQDEWNSSASLFGGTPLPYNTGIAKDWQEALWRGLHMGAALTREYASTDWSGKPIICQQFQFARAEHVFGGSTRWFGAYGEIQVPK